MPFRDILLALTTILLWSGNFVAIKIGVGELPPMILLTLRFSLTALVFLPFIKWPDRKKIVLLAEISLYLCGRVRSYHFSLLKNFYHGARPL